jgi:ankyrin repeat protein
MRTNLATEQILYNAHLLREASKKGDTFKVKSLIEELGQKNLDLTDDFFTSALMHAAQHGHNNVVKILIDAGADVDMGDQYDGFPWKRNAVNGTALMRAAGNDQALVVDTLIKAGADVDRIDKYGTALIRAAEKGHKEVFNILIKAGANVGLVDKFGYNCLMRAAENGHDELVKLSLLKERMLTLLPQKVKKALLCLPLKMATLKLSKF